MNESTFDFGEERPLAAGRQLVWIGFLLILLLMAAIGVDVALSLKTSSERSAELMRSFHVRDSMLDELRDIMNRSGTAIREYINASDPAKVENEKSDLENARLRSEQLLDEYESQVQFGPDQKKRFADLRLGVKSYWRSVSSALQWDVATKQRKGAAYDRDAIGPLRTEVRRLSREITKLNEEQLDAGEALIRLEQQRLRTRLILACFVGVGLGGLLAFFVTMRIQRLEQTAESQFQTVARARREMRDLAQRLESAQEEERKRLSRELHDEVGQSMSAMLVELSRLEAVLPQSEAIRTRLAAFRKQAEESVRSVRDMALLLRPSMLDDLGLVSALKWQGREVTRRTGMRVRVDADDIGDELPESVRTCVFRVVQEALNNCAKHAKATSVTVTFQQSAEALEVSVSDDGAGFDPSTDKGLGLLGMEERVTRLGGSIHVQSQKGKGARVTVRLPAPSLEKVT
jgi:signal transduction histidine kinase